MSSLTLDHTRPALAQFGQFIRMPALVAVAYFIGAEAAFFVGTLSDKIFAPFWPPNIILFCALLLTPTRNWWIYVAAALPAHVAAELGVGMATPQLLVAFVTNCLVAAINAIAVKKFLGQDRWFTTLRRAAIYILITTIISPAISALGGAFVQVVGDGNIGQYGLYWARWYASNALGSLTLGPVALICLTEIRWSASVAFSYRYLEAIGVALALFIICSIAFNLGTTASAVAYLPTLLYLPLPLILWAAVRFGVTGASSAVLLVSLVLIWRTLNGPSLFNIGSAEDNVFALQIFLIGLATPILLLGAAIEDTRRAGQATRESEERMAFAAASSNLGLWRLELATNYFWATRHCLEMFGLPATETPTRKALLDRIHPADSPFAWRAINRAIEDGTSVEVEFRVRRGNDDIRWIAARARPEYDDENTLVAMTGAFTDVTQRKDAEAEASLQRQEIAHLMRVSMLGELSGSLAHELTQPLTAILSNAQAGKIVLAHRNPDLTEISEVLDDIITEDSRAGEVIHRLRGLLKKGESKYEAVDLNDLINATLRLLHGEIVNRRITINTDLAHDLRLALGDAVQLQQILINLLMNAMDAVEEMSPSRRVITISTNMTDEDVEVRISDLGVGLPTADSQHEFRPFCTTKKRGLGLGLSICSTIVKTHGGALSLQNNTIEGATASFRLPSQRI
ncbi:MAG TPA: MASE1 domain-containing protein [Pseudolabrys sp.]|nr:MASE1 domain-containing protein [Pseudolabrys sp.]